MCCVNVLSCMCVCVPVYGFENGSIYVFVFLENKCCVLSVLGAVLRKSMYCNSFKKLSVFSVIKMESSGDNPRGLKDAP